MPEPISMMGYDRQGRILDGSKKTGVTLDLVLMAQKIFRQRYQHLKYTPEYVKMVLEHADMGYIGYALEMYDVFASSDPETGAAIMKRRNGVRNASKVLMPSDEKSETARIAKDYVQLILDNLIGFDEVILDLEAGNYNGFVAIEIEWWNGLPIALHPTRYEDWRWQSSYLQTNTPLKPRPFNPSVLDGQIRFEDYVGLMWKGNDELWRPTPQDKFIINSPNTRLPISRRGQMRSIAGVWSAKQILQIVLMGYCELYGIPRTIIGVPDDWSGSEGSPSPQMTQLIQNMSEIGTHGYALISKDVDITTLGHQSSEHVPTQLALERIDRQISKALNGSTLTTDTTGSTGTYSAAATHQQTEYDIAESDLENIERALNRDLITPIVYYGFGSLDYCPYLSLSIRNEARERQELDRLNVAVNQLGLRVSTNYAYEQTGIPEPEKDQDILEGDIKYRKTTEETEGEI